ncbi:MAG: sugar O-acetyltransferase [Capnocytophaga sp.]|nr:sugar O-acetyltransferase [Capnocytophaga sp.]
MTEKEKMLSGKLYLSNDQTLAQELKKCKSLIFKYNQTPPSEIHEKEILISQIIGKIGKNFHIESPFFCDYGYNIEIGDNFYANHNVIILDCAKVKIGNNVFLAPNVSLFTAGHPIDFEKRNQSLEYAFPITIGNNVWIGGNTTITPNVTIGNNVVIGAGSVITKDIPDNVIAFGNPCKVHREINEEDKKYYFKNLEY